VSKPSAKPSRFFWKINNTILLTDPFGRGTCSAKSSVKRHEPLVGRVPSPGVPENSSPRSLRSLSAKTGHQIACHFRKACPVWQLVSQAPT
jgi:hypothetical protein